MNQYYPFINEPLPYAYDALEPYVDAETMQLHHDKHLQTYIDNLNQFLEAHPELQRLSLEQMLQYLPFLPMEMKTPVRNNAGGVYNHRLFFEGLHPADNQSDLSKLPLGQAIIRQFGSLGNFERQWEAAARSVFGSGYAWLICQKGKLRIITLPNQDTPLEKGYLPILLLDVWEHAYYLKYQNRRADYIDNIWNVIHWEQAEKRYEMCIQQRE